MHRAYHDDWRSPWLEVDELSQAEAREEVERYVTRLRRGDLTQPTPQEVAFRPTPQEIREARRGDTSRWDMETINANWAALFSGSAPPAASQPPPSPSLGSTPPSGRPAAHQPSASEASACSTRRSTVTTDQYTFRAANALPNGEPDLTTLTVEQIAKARGVSKRYAYSLMRRAQEEKMGSVSVPSNQRELILSILHRSGDYIRNTDHLFEAVRETGSKLPPHDVTKVLWSLQKSQYVRFRERAGGMLYAIKLTPEGKKVAKQIAAIPEKVDIVEEPTAEPWVDQAVADAELDEVEQEQGAYTAKPSEIVTEVGPDQQDEAYDRVAEHIAKVAENARLLQQEINDLGAGPHPDQLTITLPWIKGSMGGYPVIRALRDRAIKAQKLNAAAKILEEAGEDDMVLALMAKTDFTGLEAEVVELLRLFEEIE